MRGRAIIAALLLSTASAALADEQPICADRPGLGTSTCTVPAGHWQVETGLADWTLDRHGGGRDTVIVLGETTIKYGLSDRSDIEVEVAPWLRETNHAGGLRESASGIGDVSVIYKHRLNRDGSPLEVSGYALVKAPTAKRSLGNGEWEGGLLLPIGYEIPGTPLSLGLTPELDWLADADGHGHHAAMAQVAGFGWQVSDRLALTGELRGQWDWDPAGTMRQYAAGASAAFLAGKDVQLDAGANFGLNRRTPDVEFYAGVSKRF
jgi:hypothetical protein